MEENINKKINKKKIIIISIIVFLLGISAFAVFFIKPNSTKTAETYFIDDTFKITIDNKYNLNPLSFNLFIYSKLSFIKGYDSIKLSFFKI